MTTLPETEEGESAPQEEPEEPVTSDQPSEEEKEEPEEELGVQTPAPAQEEEYESQKEEEALFPVLLLGEEPEETSAALSVENPG